MSTKQPPTSQTLLNQKVTFEFLKSHLWDAADILRGSLSGDEYRQPVMTILFLKRLNDTFEENAEKLVKEGKSQKEAWENKRRHHFFIPEEARWSKLAGASENIGEKIDHVCRIIETENLDLNGVLTNTKYNDKKKYPDDRLRKLVSHFNLPRLRNADLEKEDIFGDAYEYLLEQFADETKKKGGEFFTPREVVRLLVNLVPPTEGMSICDPTCGSGGMLIESAKYVERNGGNPRNLVLEGQESNYGNLGMCKMNLVLHGIFDPKIEFGDTLADPRLTEGGRLRTYDRVLANFPFSMDWNNTGAAKDPYKRFTYGVPPGKDKADFAFIQHMLASLDEKGQAAIISSQGVLYRGKEEESIRRRMILGDPQEKLQGDIIEGIVALPEKLFYGTGIPGCILILNKNKPAERKGKIIFIYAAKDFEERPKRNRLRPKDIDKITTAFRNFEDVDGYCHIASLDELRENDFNLNVPRYVDISEPEEPIEIQRTLNDLRKLTETQEQLRKEVVGIVAELDIEVESQTSRVRSGYKPLKLNPYSRVVAAEYPIDWARMQLGDPLSGDFSNGINKEKESYGEGTLFVNILDVFREFQIDPERLKRVQISEEEVKNYELEPGDIIIDRSSNIYESVGYPSYFAGYREPVVYSGFTFRYRANRTSWDPRFLTYLLMSSPIRKLVVSIATKSANSNVNQESYKKITVPCPPKGEQEKISSILSTVDDLIQKTNDIVEEIQRLKKALMEHLLTGQTRVRM